MGYGIDLINKSLYISNDNNIRLKPNINNNNNDDDNLPNTVLGSGLIKMSKIFFELDNFLS